MHKREPTSPRQAVPKRTTPQNSWATLLGGGTTTQSVTVDSKVYKYEQVPYHSRMKRLGSHGIRLPSPSMDEFQARAKNGSVKTIRVAAFDMDDTLINTKSGSRFGHGAHDWKFKYDTLEQKLAEFQNQDSEGDPVMAIFTNQGGTVNQANSKSLNILDTKLNMILKAMPTTMPFVFYAATRKAKNDSGSPEELHVWFRKPEPGMFEQLLIDLSLDTSNVNYEDSFFCGDAAGRETDHSADDRGLAKNAKLQFYTPEEYFLSDAHSVAERSEVTDDVPEPAAPVAPVATLN